MKNKNINNQKGSSTIEILIAFVVITLALTAVTMVGFGNNMLALDARQTQRALYHAERGIEEAFSNSVTDFTALASAAINLPGTEDDIYGNEVGVNVLTFGGPCSKIVESSIGWTPSPGRSRTESLSSVFISTTTSAAFGNDCDPTGPSDPWDNPGTYGSIDLNPSGVKGTGLDVVKDGDDMWVYMTSEAGSVDKGDFWIIDVTDPQNPDIENDNPPPPPGLDLGSIGAYDVDVAGDYAYVANASSTEQLLVINVVDKSNPNIVARRTLPGIDPLGSFPEGRSVTYYDDFVYVGTHETAGEEFSIYDVSDPTNPQPKDTMEITHNVHEIAVREKVVGGVNKTLAYIALSTTSSGASELWVLDVTNPDSISLLSKFNADGVKYAHSVYPVGDRIYLGLERGGGSDHDPNFYILDGSDVSSLSSASVLFKGDMGLKNNTVIEGIVTSGPLAFLAISDSTGGFQVWNISDPDDVHAPSNCNIYNYSEKAVSIDFNEDLIFIANESNDALRVIYDKPSVCS